ncbi:hypothetical protein [Clostridioides sp. ZZV15-6383]|uniref:hypothetical protein n=1 Tax=Clostridioides sp. ZZV15-6383 TaxID=2811498 RepID=UPI001D1123A1
MMNRLKPRILGISILFIIIIILTCGAIFKFKFIKFKLDNKLKETTQIYLSEFTEHNIVNLKTRLSGQFDMLESIAKFIGNSNNISDEEVIDNLGSDVKKRLKPQGIRSILQCKILEGNKFRGFVGFDECSYNRMWTNDEVNTLTFISKTLSMFLLKMRIQNKPCKKCPMRDLKDGDDTCKSFMRNRKFDVKANITTTTLKWFDGKDACLIFGSEVSSIESEENV